MTGKNNKRVKKGKDVSVVKANITVAKCLTWQYPEGYVPSHPGTPQPKSDYHLPAKSGLGKAKDRGYEMAPTVYRPPEDDGKVIDALRGWSNHDANRYDFDDNGDQAYSNDGGLSEKRSGDPNMGELMGHKFWNDAVRKRMEEEEEARRQAAGKGKKSSAGRDDIKGNRTSQLRAIALAEKVEVRPHDMWQMSKFKKNARPHLSTVSKRKLDRSGEERQKSAGKYGDSDIAGNGDPCTCYSDDPGLCDGAEADSGKYYDGSVNDNMDQYINYLADEKNDTKIFAM